MNPDQVKDLADQIRNAVTQVNILTGRAMDHGLIVLIEPGPVERRPIGGRRQRLEVSISDPV